MRCTTTQWCGTHSLAVLSSGGSCLARRVARQRSLIRALAAAVPDDFAFGSFFFFQAEDGIRDYKVTGVQTCALPIWPPDMRGVPVGRVDFDDRRDRAASGGLELVVWQPRAKIGIRFEEGHRLVDAVDRKSVV